VFLILIVVLILVLALVGALLCRKCDQLWVTPVGDCGSSGGVGWALIICWCTTTQHDIVFGFSCVGGSVRVRSDSGQTGALVFWACRFFFETTSIRVLTWSLQIITVVVRVVAMLVVI
jgi:hypothetical protein